MQLKSQRYSKMQLKHQLLQLTWLMMKQQIQLCADFCSQGEIIRIIDDPVNDLNAPDDAQIELKPHTPHIKFVDVNDANKFSVVIFVDLAAEKEERLLLKEKRLDSYSIENIVDKKVNLHAFFFLFLFLILKILKKFQNYMFLFSLIKLYKLTCTL